MQQIAWCTWLCLALWLRAVAIQLGSDRVLHRNEDQVTVLKLPAEGPSNLVLPLPADLGADVELLAADKLVQATSLNPGVASAQASAVLDRRRLLLQSRPVAGLLQCTVDVSCHAPGIVNVRLDFAPFGGQLGLAPVFLAKTCAADVLRGINIGQEPQGSDVVRNGLPQWTREHKPEVPYNVNEVTLYVSMAHNGNGQGFAPPHVRSTVVQQGYPGDASHSPRNVQNPDGSAIVEAQIFSDLNEGQLLPGAPKSLRMVFQCRSAGTALIELVLRPRPVWQPYGPISIWLNKTCGGGYKAGFDVGSQRGLKDFVANGKVYSQPLDVDGITDYSSFSARYLPDSTELDQAPRPKLQCTDQRTGLPSNDLQTQLSVEKDANVDENLRYVVAYSCSKRGVFDCTLGFQLQLWRSPQLRWRKMCGGDARPDIVVQSNLNRFANVFGSGRPISAWAMVKPQVWLLPEEQDISFEVHRLASNKAVLLRLPNVHSSDPDVLSVSLTNAAVVSGRVLTKAQDGATLLVHHDCKRPGKAMVTLTIPTDDWEQQEARVGLSMFGPVSFSYMKSCGKSRTPGVVLAGLVGFASIACIAATSYAAVTYANCKEEEQRQEMREAPF
jgi:hypothetical protein